MRFNGDSGSNYSYTEMNGTGSSALSARDTNQTIAWTSPQMGSISNTVGDNTTIVNIMNYSNSTINKTYLSRANRAGSTLDYQGVEAAVGLWRNTAAITSVLIGNRRSGVDYNFSVGSTFSLYGIASSSVGAKATGGTITSDSLYYYHTFAASGTFTPTQSISADVLLVAGGGGSGCAQNATRAGGGGGAGGLRYSASQSLTATGYTVTVGGGGAAGISSPATSGTNGGATSFTGLTSPSGGGYGGVAGLANANNGGSGGGGADNNNPGTGISGEGNNGIGGSGLGTGGGGGGAGAVGTAPTGGTGATYFGTIYATGGDGGHTTDAVGVAGTANTGNGAKAGRGTLNGAAGGSGIVIVRYLKA
jgi:hypothetical protein